MNKNKKLISLIIRVLFVFTFFFFSYGTINSIVYSLSGELLSSYSLEQQFWTIFIFFFNNIGLMIFIVCNVIAIIGLVFNKKIGILFIYPIVGIVFIMFIIEFYKHWVEHRYFSLEDLAWGTLFASTPVLLMLGVRYLKKLK